MSICVCRLRCWPLPALTAEVDALKQSLELSENELGRAKKQLEEKEGM